MRDHTFTRPFCHSILAVAVQAVVLAILVALIAPRGFALAETAEAQPAVTSALHVVDPFDSVKTEEAETDPFETVASDMPVDAAAYVPKTTRWDAKPANFEVPSVLAPPQQPAADASANTLTNTPTSTAAAKDPCAAAQFKPLRELGISIAQPAGQAPTDFATPCWDQVNAGPNGACRCWPTLNYNWDPTCLCYRPLYFEEINAERYGYVCDSCCCCCCGPGNCVQSAASAAHFFGTIPCLPYCMADECPGECVYTLGHYRPGTCGTPWRWHWPSCDPLAAAATGGVYTGLIFAIP